MNEPYLSDVPFAPIALHPIVPAARARVIAAARDLLAVPATIIDEAAVRIAAEAVSVRAAAGA